MCKLQGPDGILPYNTMNMKNAGAVVTLCLSGLLSAQSTSETALRHARELLKRS